MAGEVEAQVVLTADGSPISQMLAALREAIGLSFKEFQKGSLLASQGLAKLTKEQQDAYKVLVNQTKLLNQLQGGLNTQNPSRSVLRDKQRANESVNAGKFAQGFKKDADAVGVLTGRLNDLDRKIAKTGTVATQADLTKRLGLTGAIKEAKELEGKLAQLDRRARTTGGSFGGARENTAAAQSELLRQANDRRVTKFTAVDDLRARTAEMSELVGQAEVADTRVAAREARTERRAQRTTEFIADQRKKEITLELKAAKERERLFDAELRAETRRQEQAERAAARLVTIKERQLRRNITTLEAYLKEEFAVEERGLKDRLANAAKLEKAYKNLEAFEEAQRVKQRNLLISDAEKASKLAASQLDKQLAEQDKRIAAANKIVTEDPEARRRRITAASRSFEFAPSQLSRDKLPELNDQLQRATRNAEGLRVQLERAVAAGGEPIGTDKLLERIQEAEQEEKKLQAEVRQTNAIKEPKAPTAPGSPAPKQSPLGRILSGDNVLTTAGRAGVYGLTAGAIYTVINAFKEYVGYVTQYETTLKELQAISDSSTSQMAKLGETIQQVSATSKFATLDVAKAARQLAEAGLNAKEVGQALPASINLATATASTPDKAADVTTSAIEAFDLQGSEFNRVSDIIAVGTNKSKLSLEGLGNGIARVGPIAREMNLTLEQTVGALATLADAGVKGTRGAAGLEQLFSAILNPTDKFKEKLAAVGLTLADVDVASLGLSTVLGNMSKAGFNGGLAFEGLGRRAAVAYIALKDNIGALDENTRAMNNTGAAAKATATANNTVAAAWQEFVNSLRPGAATLEFLTTRLKVMIGNLSALSEAFGGVSSSQAKASVEVKTSADRFKEASDEVVAHKQKLAALDEEIDRVGQQQAALNKSQPLLAQTTKSLEARFEGLSLKLRDTARDAGSVVRALGEIRAEELKTGAAKFDLQAGAALQIQRENETRLRFGGPAAARTVLAVPGLKNDPLARQLAGELGNPTADSAGSRITDLIAALAKEGKALPENARKLVEEVRNAANQREVNRQVVAQSLEQRNVRLALGSDEGKATKVALQQLTDAAKAAEIASRGKSPAQRAALLNPIQAQGRQFEARLAGLEKKGGSSALIAEYFASSAAGVVGKARGEQAETGKEKRADASAARKADAAARQAAREAERKIREAQAAQEKVDNAALAADAAEYAKDLEAAKRTNDPQKLVAALAKYRAAVAKDERDGLKAIDDKVKAFKGSAEQSAKLRADLTTALKDKVAKLLESIDKVATKFIDDQIKEIETTRKTANAQADEPSKIAKARIQGLNRYSNRFSVPDYVRKNAEDAAARADEAAIPIKISNNDRAISKLTARLPDAQAAAELNPEKNGPALEKLKADLEAIRTENEALKASFGSNLEIPTTLKGALEQAAQAWRLQQGPMRSFKQTLIQDVGGALATVQGGLEQFFTSITSGSGSALQAFRSFALGMIQYIQQLVLKIIATKIIDMLISIGAGRASAGSSAGTGGDAGTTFSNTPAFTGGLLRRATGGGIPGISGGGGVLGGVPERDSTLLFAAQGEYVVRKSAVDSVGINFMENLNRSGKKALGGTNINVPPPARQEVNIWAVKEKPPQQMGPNDVLMIIADDVLKNGSTKQLIQQVANGG